MLTSSVEDGPSQSRSKASKDPLYIYEEGPGGGLREVPPGYGGGVQQLHFRIEGDDWKKQWNLFVDRIGGLANSWQKSPADVQNAAAMIVANLYRQFIREGVEPENATLTQIIRGVYPPLSGLADYIVVIKASKSGSGRNHRPAIVTFHPDWATIAFLHDRGYTFIPTKEQRDYLFMLAQQKTGSKKAFLENDMGSHGIWAIPARPHAHFLGSPQMNRILEMIAKAYISGKFDASMLASQRPVPDPWTPKFKTSIDDMKSL